MNLPKTTLIPEFLEVDNSNFKIAKIEGDGKNVKLFRHCQW